MQPNHGSLWSYRKFCTAKESDFGPMCLVGDVVRVVALGSTAGTRVPPLRKGGAHEEEVASSHGQGIMLLTTAAPAFALVESRRLW